METMARTLKRIGPGLLAILGLAAGALAARRMSVPSHAGFLVLAIGEIALALVAFAPREIGAAFAQAFRRPLRDGQEWLARQFWESAARNACVLGALGAFVGLVVLFSTTEGLRDVDRALGERLLGPWLGGILLAALLAIPALRASTAAADGAFVRQPAAPPVQSLSVGLGYALFAAMLAFLLLAPGTRPGFEPSAWLLRGPAWLAVAGGALAIVLYLGDRRRGRSATLALAVAGLVAAVLGLLQALHGFALSRITSVAAGITFLLSACVATLVGLGAVALPLEDRERRLDGTAPFRLVWYGLPIVTMLLLAAAVALTLTPMAQRGG